MDTKLKLSVLHTPTIKERGETKVKIPPEACSLSKIPCEIDQLKLENFGAVNFQQSDSGKQFSFLLLTWHAFEV